MEVVKGQAVVYNFAGKVYSGRVLEVYDDFYIAKGRWIGRVKVTPDNRAPDRELHPVFKNGIPVMKKRFGFC